MDRFLDNAARILEGGAAAARSGNPESSWTVLLTPGGIRMVANSDWPLDSIARESGAEMAYRVSVSGALVQVDGVSGGRRCSLQSEPPAETFRRLLSSHSQHDHKHASH